MNADGSEQKSLTNPPATTAYDFGDFNPDWSPDGERIAFDNRLCRMTHVSYLCHDEANVINADGSGLMPLAAYGDPAWSPNGERIAFSGIYVTNADGSGLTRLTCNRFAYWDPDWQPVFDGPAPPPDRAECARTLRLTYSEKESKFWGTLALTHRPTGASLVSACDLNQTVSVYERKKGKDRKLGSDLTRVIYNRSQYAVKEENADGKFYARTKQTIAAGATCLAAKSKTIKVG